MSIYFSADAPKRWVEELDIFYFGFSDTFGRYHWCSRRNAKKFRKDVVEDFGAIEPKKTNMVREDHNRGRRNTSEDSGFLSNLERGIGILLDPAITALPRPRRELQPMRDIVVAYRGRGAANVGKECYP